MLYLLKINFAWSIFKEIQINEKIEIIYNSLKTNEQIICFEFLILKTFVNILQFFIDIKNVFALIQKITFQFQ